MKKLLTLAAALLIGLTACQKEENSPVGDLQQFEVIIPQVELTRADGDGTQINRCQLQVYRNGLEYGDRLYSQVVDGKATFTMRLVSSQSYDFVFWADYVADNSEANIAQDCHYNTEDLQNVTYSYYNDILYTGNDETYDAFSNALLEEEVTAAFQKTITLTRPFGQLSVQTLDLGEIPSDETSQKELTPRYVEVIFSDLTPAFNARTSEVIASAEGEPNKVSYIAPVKNEKTGFLTVDYIFAPEDESALADFTMKFYNAEPESGENTYITENSNFKNIPVRRNYQTKVTGNLITKQGDFNIIIDPIFGGEIPYIIIDNEQFRITATADEFKAAVASGENIYFEENIELPSTDVLNFSSEELSPIYELNGKSLTFKAPVTALTVENGATVTLRNGSLIANDITGGNAWAYLVSSNGTLNLENMKVEASESAVGIEDDIKSGKVTIKNSEINAGIFALSTNASPEATTGVEVVVENSRLVSEAECAILWNVPSKLTIKDSYIYGEWQGAVFRGGDVTLENCEVVLNFDQDDATVTQWETIFDEANWRTGNYVEAAAITVGNKLPNSYQYPTTLKLVNTKVSTTGKNADKFPALYAYANQGDGLGVTITYDADCEFNGGFEVGSANVIVNGSEFVGGGIVESAASTDELKELISKVGTSEGELAQVHVTLTSPATLTGTDLQVAENTAISLDLNNQVLTLSGGKDVASSGKISIKNGTIETSEVALLCEPGGSIELENVVYDADPAGWGCVFIAQNAENASITIKNSKINGGYYALTSNATTNPVATGTITIENSEFAAAESAMMINIPCTIVAKNCKFTGGWQGAFVRGGNVTFEDCSITLAMDKSYNDWPEKHNNADGTWQSGNQAETAALLIGNRCKENAGGYDYPTSVTLKNITFAISGETNSTSPVINANTVPAVSIWSRVEEGNGASFNYDDASKASFDAVGTGLKINDNGKGVGYNLTINNAPYSGN